MDFSTVCNLLKSDLAEIDEVILSFACGKSPLIQEVSNHIVSSGGKRIRPVVLLLATKLCDNTNSNLITKRSHNLSAAVELIHTATLLHDDVVDNSLIRRGKKTANAIWDNKASILVGDYLFSIAFQLMVRDGNLRVLDLLAKVSSIMSDGEVMQLENSTNLAISVEKYFDIIFGKTASLFAAASEVGGLINQRSEADLQALRGFGKNLGLIFQIVDDLLDYSSQNQILGKEVGKDFFEGKVTLPIIVLYSLADSTDKIIIEQLFANQMIENDEQKSQRNLQQILSLLNKYDCFLRVKEMALDLRKQAQQELDKIVGNSDSKNHLIAVLNHSLERLN